MAFGVITCTLLLAFLPVSTSVQTDSPDVRFLKEVGLNIWNNRDELFWQFIDELEFDNDFEELLLLLNTEPEERISCAQCVTFVGALQGLINTGLTFDDIRDQAVVVCYNVTEVLGYNGTVMCEGIIDNYGPHVYYVLNVTEENARGVCEFHQQCDERGIKTHEQKFTAKAEKILPQFRETRSNVEKKDMLRVVHISDVHFDDKYSPGSPTDCNLPLCCRDYWEGTGIANEWGDYQCNMPIQTAELLLEFIASLQPDFLMQTGDTPPHALWEESQTGQIEYSRWLAEAIQRLVPGVPTYTCVGNHETFPTNLYYTERPQIQAFNRNLTEMYAAMSNWTEEAEETMEISGYYVMQVRPGLKIMAINSNYGFTDNFYGVLLPESDGWLQHITYLEDQFIIARENGDKIIILHHHTIGGGFTYYVDWINLMLETYGDVIIMQLQGHSHSDSFQLSSDENLNATSVMFSTSSMGPRTNRNPTVRMYYLDPVTYEAMEFEHYFINLTDTQNGMTPDISLMYSTFEDYGMPDLSLASFSDFITRMETDDDLYYLYKWNEGTRAPGSEPGECTGECRQTFSCDMRTSSPERYEQCLAETL